MSTSENTDAVGGSRWALSTADLAQAAVFAALIAALGLPGQINLSGSVPITLQTMGVMMAGAILGPRKGALAVGLFMVLALVGLPILAGGYNGWSSLSSGRGGFFLGFLPAVILIGVLTSMMMPRYRILWGIGINILGGMLVIYLCGVIWLLIRGTDLWAAISINGPFLVGDFIKAVIAALVASQVHRGWPGLITPLRRRTATPAADAG